MMLGHVVQENYGDEGSVTRVYRFGNGKGALVSGKANEWHAKKIEFLLSGFKETGEIFENVDDEYLNDILTEIKEED